MDHYFTKNKNLKKENIKIKNKICNEEFIFNSSAGVFSKKHIDYGTKLLLENINIQLLKGDVLDLGCGIGVVGIVIAKLNKNVKIDMVDVNKQALNLSKENSFLNNVNTNVFESDIYNQILKKYDYIITNPPIKAGKEIVKKFLLDSYNNLKEKGNLYFVMRKDHGLKSIISILKEKYNPQIIKRSKGFYIVKCEKK